jgi:hypothetical protein
VATIYPIGIDNNVTLPQTIDLVTPVVGEVTNVLRDAIIAIEAELGIDPSREYGTVRARLDAMELGIGGLGGGIDIISKDSTPIVLNATQLNFVGPGVEVIDAGSGIADIEIYQAIQIQESIAVDSLGDTSFTLSETPLDQNAVKMFVNGLKQRYGADYSVVGTEVTYSGSYELDVTDEVEFWYLVSGAIASPPSGILTIQDDGSNIDTATTLINFIGDGVGVTSPSTGVVNVTISAGSATQTLAEVLLEGNTSDGTDIIVESSDIILDTARIISTSNTEIFSNTSISSNGGFISLTSGSSTNANGGAIGLSAGSGVQGGTINLATGAGTTNNGGAFTVTTGNSTSANGGQLSLNTGSGQVGGNFNITTGAGSSTRAGNITLSVGNSNANGGTVSISSGPSGASGNGGSLSLNTGLGAGASGNGGSFVVQAGESIGGGTGGSVSINAGGANVNGGPIFITAGSSLANTGGNVTITAGSGPNISGSVNIFAGGAASTPGDITFNTEGSVIANAPFIASGLSYPTADGSAGNVIVTNGSGVLSFASASLGSHASSHEAGGSDEIDGYNLSLLYSPSNYDSPTNDLIGEHIAAIDDALGLTAFAVQVQESIAVDSLGDTSFTLSQTPLDSSAVKMFVNGLKQRYGFDYTVSGTAVTYLGSYELDVTDEVEFWYLVSGTIIPAQYNLTVQDEGVDVDTDVNTINFIGSGVVATSSSAGVINVTIDTAGEPHADTHENGGSDEIDGYNLSLSYSPNNYISPVNNIIGEHISAIDYALDNINFSASSPGPINYTVNLGPDLEGSFEDLVFEADGYFDLTFQANKISTRMLWIVATDEYGTIYETCKRIKAITNGSSVTFFSTSDVYGSTDGDQDEEPAELVLDFSVDNLNLTVMLTNNIITEADVNVAWVSQLEYANIPGVPS